ncbi:MAG: 2-oxoisovalerate dehydrogenase [Bacillota bacterium]|nr:2-oxoisovalerate dehydrogenase [Bacillota bacterium]
MDSEIVFLVEESPEGGYQARALGYSIFTEADSLAELKEAVRDAVRCHFDDDQDRPRVIRLHFVRDEVLALFPTRPVPAYWSIP